jgi:hypothetical protein
LQNIEIPSKKLENILFLYQWGHAQTYEKPWKMNVFPIFATAKAPSVASSYHSINGKSLAKH